LSSLVGRRIVVSMTRRTRLVLALGGLSLCLALGVGSVRSLSWPDWSGPVPPNPEASARVQSALAQLFLREAGLSSRQEPLALSADEVNAFLGQIEVRDPPAWPVRVRMDTDQIELGGVTTLGRLLGRGLGSGLTGALPGLVRNRPAWVSVSGQISVRGGRAEFLTRTATIGRQRVPVALLWHLLGGRPPTLTWRMPRIVERVDVEPGRLFLHTRQARSGKPSPG
jgi:hypothetical protein